MSFLASHKMKTANLIGFKALVEREVLRFTSVFKQTIFPPLVSGFLYFLIFGLTIGSHMTEVQGIPYMNFLIPGLVMMYLIEGSYNNTSNSLFISRWAGHIQEILVSPLSYLEMVMALLIGGLIRGLVVAGGVFLVSLFFVRTPIDHPFIVASMALLVSLSFSSIGAMVALIAEEFEHISVCTTFLITPLIFLGGVFHSIHMLPESLQFWTRYNPIFYMINGMRYGMIGLSDVPITQCFMVVTILFTILFSMTVYLFKIGFKLRK
jgi:ABC-2 type transport system permease protein